VKQTIAELENRVEDLTTQLIATKLENDSLKAENQLAPPGSIPQQLVPGSIPLDDPFENYPGLDVVQQRHLHASQYMPIDSQFAESSMMSLFGRGMQLRWRNVICARVFWASIFLFLSCLRPWGTAG